MSAFEQVKVNFVAHRPSLRWQRLIERQAQHCSKETNQVHTMQKHESDKTPNTHFIYLN